jgi:hypothetical protein
MFDVYFTVLLKPIAGVSVKFSPLCHNQPNFNVKWYLNIVHVFRQMVYSFGRLRKIDGKFIECWEVCVGFHIKGAFSFGTNSPTT